MSSAVFFTTKDVWESELGWHTYQMMTTLCSASKCQRSLDLASTSWKWAGSISLDHTNICKQHWSLWWLLLLAGCDGWLWWVMRSVASSGFWSCCLQICCKLRALLKAQCGRIGHRTSSSMYEPKNMPFRIVFVVFDGFYLQYRLRTVCQNKRITDSPCLFIQLNDEQ